MTLGLFLLFILIAALLIPPQNKPSGVWYKSPPSRPKPEGPPPKRPVR